MKLLVIENLRVSLGAIRSHLLRTILTVLIIAFGIMALVGILTAIDSIKFYLNSNFALMGANTFTIRNRSIRVHMGGHSNRPKDNRAISFEEALDFKNQFTFPAFTSVYVFATSIATVKYESEKSNPNVGVIGTDENYFLTSGNEIGQGRNFSGQELFYGAHVAIIGHELQKSVFKHNENPIDKIISIGPGKYKVIGVLKEKGSSIGFSGDRNAILPLSNVRNYFARPNMSYQINVLTKDPQSMDPAIGEATGLFRTIRKVRLGEEDNFDISKSDNLAKMLIENMKSVTMAATIIGLITLVGAAIGLMNIMLVSVTERTREIGIRKAIGANRRIIRNQFLVEAILIGQLGGALGIVLGIIAGNSISFMIGSKFIIPWAWILAGIILCFIVAVVSGLYPAVKASRLDPIEALRYE